MFDGFLRGMTMLIGLKEGAAKVIKENIARTKREARNTRVKRYKSYL
jgi:hypothetical protein